MDADTIVQTAGPPLAVRERSVAAPVAQDRRFWIGLSCAAVLHAALIFGMMRSLPRQMGEREGRPDGISVELVDAADLLSKNTFREDGSTAGGEAAKRPTQPAPPAPPTPPAAEAAPPSPPAAEAAPPPAPPLEKQKIIAFPIDKEALDLVSPPEPKPKKTEPEAAPKPTPKPQPKQTPPLQLNLPEPPIIPGGRSASVMRPPGATRSGENDEFGRGVIRALRQTMPSPRGLAGRVTIRLLLSENGNLVDVQLIRSAGEAVLDQSVVFAVKQSSFPIPPGGATLTDRTFLVTYIYN